MKVIFVSHAFRSNPSGNRRRVATICRQLARAGYLPLAPHLALPLFLDEQTERELALHLCLEMVRLADEVRIYGPVTEGMQQEIDEADRLEVPVIDGGQL